MMVAAGRWFARWMAVPIWCAVGLVSLHNLKTAAAQKPGAPHAKVLAAEKEAFDRVCGACHSTTMADSFRSQEDWQETVGNMIQAGAKGSDEDFNNVLHYLARNWTKVDINTAAAGQIAAALNVKEELGAAIVKYRAGHGPFAALEDLKKVPGLAQIDIESRKDRILFSNPAGKENRF